MADIAIQTNETVSIGDKILVTVESIIPDIIVVSFEKGIETFQGALLNVNQRALPCDINSPKSIVDRNGDKLTTLSARFTYFQENKYHTISSLSSCSSVSSSSPTFDSRKTLGSAPKMRKACRPTVRLRPRQVLCNKCQSICNEQNENIAAGKKRKKCNDISVKQENVKSRPTELTSKKSERTSALQQSEKKEMDERKDDVSTLIRGTSQVHLTEHYDGNQMNQLEKNIRLCWLRSATVRESLQSQSYLEYPSAVRSQISIPLSNNKSSSTVASSESMSDITAPEKRTLSAADSMINNKLRTSKMQRTLREKRSIDSMEDIWHGNIFEDIIKSTSMTQVTPVIKILVGTHGEGTILKIPSKMKKSVVNISQNHDQCTGDNGKSNRSLMMNESFSTETIPNKSNECQIDKQEFFGKDLACAKSARRAQKKAKKEARRNIISLTDDLPPSNASSRFSAKRDSLLYHKREHRVKHKNERKHHEIQEVAQDLGDESMTKCIRTTNIQQEIYDEACDVIPGGKSYTAIKEQCLKQKLSILLKRLNTDAYTTCDYPVSNSLSECKSSDISSEELSELEKEKSLENKGETSDNASHFQESHQFAIQLDTTHVAHCFTTNGRRMDVGDIVWGKIHGFPWWPGKVLSISVSPDGNGTSDSAQAHVAWYGSSTCSLMSCDRLSPFLETFKTRYNKKKRGPYKEAIRQAQSEAQTQMSMESTHKNVASVRESSRDVNIMS